MSIRGGVIKPHCLRDELAVKRKVTITRYNREVRLQVTKKRKRCFMKNETELELLQYVT